MVSKEERTVWLGRSAVLEGGDCVLLGEEPISRESGALMFFSLYTTLSSDKNLSLFKMTKSQLDEASPQIALRSVRLRSCESPV